VTLVRVGLAPRAAGLSYEAAQEHWRTAHRDAALRLPGLRAYVQDHAVLRGGRPLLPHPGFDVCAETEFDDPAAMRAAFASEEYRGAVSADELGLIDRTRFLLALTSREVLRGAEDAEPGGRAAKLMTFLRAAPSTPAASLLDVVRGAYAEEAAAAGALRHELLVVDRRAHEGELPPCCDLVDLLWFADPDAALDAVLGPLAERGAWLLGGLAFGSERTIVRAVRMR
jgi:uncharacterized protein (TIGR02118 family)